MNDQAVLHAGGIVPTNSKLGKDDAVDAVVARAYVHPVMPDRVVVRLCAEGVAAGDELEMSTLGFGAPGDRGVVGKERKRPLGFPGWALVHDPKNARYALDVVKELKKHARKAKSKPGHAKEAFDAIAAKLGKTVPHFLPSFYEEVGRVFIEHGAINYASQMFGKARQVEAVHALEVDEQHRIDGFLEFALAGAVTTKSLSEYGKELSAHHEPKQAYAHFRQLCVQRTLGGMPPWSGMAKDLGRLAKAAKLDTAAEDAALIAEIIESPALAKAAGEFWRAYAEPIAMLGKSSAAVRGVLLNLFPTGTSQNSNSELDDIWLDLLDSTGATDALIGEAAPEAQPANGRAAWFDKLASHVARGWRGQTVPPRVFGLLRKMAPALIADGKPIKGAARYRIDLDLAELALELGIAVEPPEGLQAEGSQWTSTVALAEHGRDPVRCAAHPKLGLVLRQAVIGAIGGEAFDIASRGKQGFLDAKRHWLESALEGVATGGLPALEAALITIEGKVSAGTFAELPDLHARFAALELAPTLTRTLHVGLIDEFGWPALEDLVRELSPDGKTEITLHGAPAAVVAATKTRAVAIVGNERKAEHDFVIPPKHELITARYIGGQYLVVLKEGYKVRCYWSSAPHDLWDPEGVSSWGIQSSVAYAAVTTDGAWLEAAKPLRPGDRILPTTNRISAYDGATAWVAEYSSGEHRFRELSPSGELGRHSWPAWIEAFAADEWKLDATSYYLPAPAGVTASPLGVADGFVGTRIRYRGTRYVQTHREIETIDGGRHAGDGTIVTELLAFPDGGERRPLAHEYSFGNLVPPLAIHAPGCAYIGSRLWGGDPRYGRGQATPMSIPFLHLCSARDVAGSRRLHATTDDDARALIAAAPELPPLISRVYGSAAIIEFPSPEDLPGLLPEVTHPLLRKGIAGVATLAKQLIAKRDKLARERDPNNAAVVVAAGPTDTALLEMLGGWGHQQYAQQGSGWAQLERVGAVFASDDRSDRTVKGLGHSVFDWLELAATPSSLVFLALAIGTPADKRTIAIALYDHLITKLPSADKLRVTHVHGDLEGEEANAMTEFQVRWRGGNAYAIRQWGYQGNNYHVVEYAPSGVFAMLPGLLIDTEIRGAAPTVTTAELREAVTAGKTSWSADTAERLAAATGLTSSEAVFLWAGCPNAKDHGANFLPKELRETLGLKSAQAAIARDALKLPRFRTKIAVLDEAGRAGVAALLDGTAADVLAAAWTKRYGRRVSIPEAVIAKADALLSGSVPAVLGWVLGGEDEPRLTVDANYGFDEHGVLHRTASAAPLVGQPMLVDGEDHFDALTLSMLPSYLAFLYGELPVGDPLRALAVKAYELTLQRFENPALWLIAAAAYLEKPKVEALDKQLEILGGEMLPVSAGHTLRRLPGGAVMRAGTNVTVTVRPVELDAKARAMFEPIVQQLHASAWPHLTYLRSPELRAMMERITKTPVPDGGWEQNPQLSVPKLVDKVMKKHALSREAAALYLQYLVLLRPTAKEIAEYNDWKPKVITEALAELVDKELLLEAKRERAQRGHFLPGGWEALKSPSPPLETWKLPLYGHRTADGHVRTTFGSFQAMVPFHQLFERAWKRIEDGDEPRYEEVKR